jgi:hypothetical protein
MRRVAVAAFCAVLLLSPTPAAGAAPKTKLTKQRATAIFLANPKIADWLRHYPPKTRTTETTYSAKYGNWTIKVWTSIDKVGEVATGRVSDATGLVIEAWTGPQVAWKMARGYGGAFGGKEINSARVWLAFCVAFLLGLADFRRPLSIRNLDLLVLVSFSVSLWYFNKGHVFTSVSLVYPPLVYLLGRMLWSSRRGRSVAEARPLWPVWVLAAATVFLAGFRLGLNVEDSNVIDVGYSGVVGADRIAHGQAPYGHFPVEEKLKPCGPADEDGEIRDRIQTNGRCESANPQGDTYGPVAYEAYLPGYWIFGWSGKWDDLPAAHFASVVFDFLCVLGLALVGLRFGGARLAATLAFAWVAWPFTQYVSNSNTNDAPPALFLIWGFWLVTSPVARGAFTALAGWTKFAPLVVAPLWLSYPDARDRWREKLVFLAAFLAATLAAFSILLLEPNPLHAAHVFWDRTIKMQVDRDSPFSIWDWKQYRAGLPDLHILQRVLEVLLVVGAVAAYFLPRRKSARQLAALTAALLIGFELVLTHWFYLYLPWFFPFVAIVVLTGGTGAEPVEVPVRREHDARALVTAG